MKRNFRILHFADLHIGHENYGRVDAQSGLNTRLLDFLKAFDNIVDYALQDDIGLVVFAGDAYKTRDPSPTYQREFAKRIKKIAAKVPIVLIIGNHDIPPSFGKADTLEIYPTLEVPNVYVFSKPIVSEINGLQIVSLPWIPRSILLQEAERKKSIEQIRDVLSNRITEIFKDLLNKLDSQKPAIAVVHQSVSGGIFASNQDAYVGHDPIIPASALSDSRLSYVAIGHLHKYQVLNENPPVIYSGSPERVDFGEEGEEKGFVIATINPNKKTKYEFIKLNARKFKTIHIDVSDSDDDPNKYILNQIRKVDLKDAIVRINIQGKEIILSRIMDSELKNALKDAYFIASIAKKSEKRITKIETINEELDEIGWLNKYLENKKFKKEEAMSIREAAKNLIDEVGHK